MAKKKETIEDLTICQGIRLSKTFSDTRENRLLTLLVKGLVVYFLTMGSIGFYLSCFDIEYNVLLCHVVILVMALLCAMLYYRLLIENLGYLILLVVFGGLIYAFKTYINSGFYAIVNMTVDGAAQYFNIDIQRVYSEQIENRYVTVTFAVLFIGIVLDVFLNVYISRRMQYVTAIFVIMGLNMIPLYLVSEPDGLYVFMVLGGMAMAYVFRSGKHYSPQVSIKRDDIKFKEKGKKHELAYVYDVKAMANAGIIALALVMALVATVSAFKPKESFNVGYQGNEYKELTMAAVSTILMDGWYGFFRMSRDVGGLQGGELGSVSTIRLDYQTDLYVQLTPYTYDRIYLKGFTGVIYNPYENCWTSIENLDDYDETITPEANTLRDCYLNGNNASAEALIKVFNVETDKLYVPYYFYNGAKNKQYTDMVFYPRLDGNNTFIDERYYEEAPYTDADLYVPKENIHAVSVIAKKLGNSGTNQDVIDALTSYYQENFPYTIQPGKTPSDEDFINDFLTEKKKGYCAHYASAAVLIFRYMGIPARYVEGYAIDYEQLYNAEIVEGAKYEDYYDGYSEIGETAMVEVKVTDADAHAWVEVYDSHKGWCPIEVTPYSTSQEEVEDFWTMFADMMDDSENLDAGGINDAVNINQTVNRIIRNIVNIVIIIMAIFVMGIIGVKFVSWIKYMMMFAKADLNDKLIMKYQRMCKKIRKKDHAFFGKINYRQQVEYLVWLRKQKNGDGVEESLDNVIAILEKAGFAKDEISVEEYNFMLDWCKEYL